MSEQLSIRGELLTIGKNLGDIGGKINATGLLASAPAMKQLLRDLVDQTSAITMVMQRMAIDLGFPAGSVGGTPFRVMISPERLDIITPAEARAAVDPDVLKAQEPIYLTQRERAFAAAAIQFVGDNMPEEAGDLLPDLNQTEVADLVSVLKVED